MVQLSMSSDEFGRLICSIGDGKSNAVVTAADLEEAASGLSAGLAALEDGGAGECRWPEGVGEYRWVFRRVDDQVRLAVLWSTGTMTGWEHVFWGETAYPDFLTAMRREVARVTAPASA